MSDDRVNVWTQSQKRAEVPPAPMARPRDGEAEVQDRRDRRSGRCGKSSGRYRVRIEQRLAPFAEQDDVGDVPGTVPSAVRRGDCGRVPD